MLKKMLIIAGAVAFASSAVAQSPTVKKTPGHQERLNPSQGPGASDYAPGQKMQDAKQKGTFTGPGASDYAPGQPTTTGSSAPKKK